MALLISNMCPPAMAGSEPLCNNSYTLRVGQTESQSGLEEIQKKLGGLEEWIRESDLKRDLAKWTELTDPAKTLIQSFSGIRAEVNEEIPLPVNSPQVRKLSAAHQLIFARYAYFYALSQFEKFPQRQNFTFVIARDPRPTGSSVMETQKRGMVLAAQEWGQQKGHEINVQFVELEDDGIVPTPFAESLARMVDAQGGVIITASHNTLKWNGSKYLTASHEPQGASIEGGILISAGQMGGIITEFKQWAAGVPIRSAETLDFLRRLNQVSAASVTKVSRGELLQYAIQEARKMWSLENKADFESFQNRAAQIKIVVDPNGGAAVWYYAEFLRAFGFNVIEINNRIGRPQHRIEPIEEALEDARKILQDDEANISAAMDFDSDRGNVEFRDPVTGEILELTPQAVSAFNIAMALSRRQTIRVKTGDTRKLAVVVHSAPSGRQREIANVFWAQLFGVDVGEVNVLQEMRELEREGYDVVVGAEVANGGTVFRGDHPNFLGDTSRNGAMTALFTGIIASTPEIGLNWLRARNKYIQDKKLNVPLFEMTSPTMGDLTRSLPGEEGEGDWHIVTLMDKPGEQGDVPEELVIRFKRALLKQIIDAGFDQLKVTHHQETAESPVYGSRNPFEGLDKYGKGGTTIRLETPDGREVILWFRGSLTEGMFRVSVEVRGHNAEEVAEQFIKVFKGKWYPAALKEIKKAAAGLEEGGNGPATVEEAVRRYFGKNSGREGEILLENFLAENWRSHIEAAARTLQKRVDYGVTGASNPLRHAVERHEKQIAEFVRLVESDRAKAGLPGKIGPYWIPPLEDKDIPARGQRSGTGDLAMDIPWERAHYEIERLHLMARIAIQRALGKEIVVNIGLGFVGTAVSTATAAEGTRMYGTISRDIKKKFQYRAPLEGKQDAYLVVAYQRPSEHSAYKVQAVNQGRTPIHSRDPQLEEKIRGSVAKGALIATHLAGAIASADIIMLETELHVAKILPKRMEWARVDDESTLNLMHQVGTLMQKDALVIVESTVSPGFTRNSLLPTLKEALQSNERRQNGLELLEEHAEPNLAHAFQRLEPGVRWYQSLLEYERVGAGITPRANQLLKRYFETVGFRFRLFTHVEAVEFMKTLENAWRFGLLELMAGYMRAAEIVGVNSFKIARLIAAARPETHAAIVQMPSLQVGGYCVPKEFLQIATALVMFFGLSEADLVEIFDSRFVAAINSDFRGQLAPARAYEALAEQGRRLDDADVHMMGVTYGPGVADTRMAGPERAVREFARLGVDPRHMTATDPYASEWPQLHEQNLHDPERWGYGIPNQMGLADVPLIHTTDPYQTLNPHIDVLVMGTRHPQYVGKGRLKEYRAELGSDKDLLGRDKSDSQIRRDKEVLGQLERIEGLDPVKMAACFMGREGVVLIDTFEFFSDKDYKLFLALGWSIKAFGRGDIPQLENDLTTAERVAAVESLIVELRAVTDPEKSEEVQRALEKAEAQLAFLKTPGAATEAHYHLMQARQQQYYAQLRLKEAVEWLDDEDPRVVRMGLELEVASARIHVAEVEGQLARQRVPLERRGRLQNEEAQLKSTRDRLVQQQRADLARYAEETIIQPAKNQVIGLVKRTHFFNEALVNYLVTKPALSAADETSLQNVIKAQNRAQQFEKLADFLDKALHMLDYLLIDLSKKDEDAVERFLTTVRHEEESRHPARALKPRSRKIDYTIYGEDDSRRVVSISVNAVHPFRFVNDSSGRLQMESDTRNWTNSAGKQLTDLARIGDEDFPRHWGKYFVVVRPKLVPIDQDNSQFRAYPAFNDLPPELAMWLARVYGKGYALSTLASEGAIEQDKVLFVMVIDPHGAGSGRAGYLFWADSKQPVISITPDGREAPISVKGIGLFTGGDPAFPNTSVETLGPTRSRVVAGGMTPEGNVGLSRLEQFPGMVGSPVDEVGLALLSVTNAAFDGRAPRAVYGASYSFTHSPTGQDGSKPVYYTVARQEPPPAPDRLGWRFRKDLSSFDPEKETSQAAEILGRNAAELLAHLPTPGIHIALTGDNVQANGYLTDPGSIVPPLYQERNPYGAFHKYFGFAMQSIVYGWQQMKTLGEGGEVEVDSQNLMRLRSWLAGFMRHFLASGKVRRALFERFNNMSKLSDDQFLEFLHEHYQRKTNKDLFDAFTGDLIDTIWDNYLTYQILKDRIRRGYSYLTESTYTATARERLDVQNYVQAKGYLDAHEGVLKTSKELIDARYYPHLDGFDFDKALAELDDKRKLLGDLHDRNRRRREGNRETYAGVYPLNMFGPEKAITVAQLDLEGLISEERSIIHIAGELPKSVGMVEKDVPPSAGLEELPTLKEWLDALHDPILADQVLAEHYSADIRDSKRKQLLEWTSRAVQLEGEHALSPDQQTVITRAPGRVPWPFGGRHLDYIGFMGGSIGSPTQREVVAFVQVDDGLNGRVQVNVVAAPDEELMKPFQNGPRSFSLTEEWVNPENPDLIDSLSKWDEWASQATQKRRDIRSPDPKLNYADDLVAAAVAFLRTKFGDPSGQFRKFFEDIVRQGKGIRIVFASDLPASGGLSSSSAVLEAAAQALNVLAGSPLDTEGLIHVGYAERFFAGSLGGIKDHAHLMYRAGFLGVAPIRFIQSISTIPGTILLLDSGISRDNASAHSKKLTKPNNDEQNIKGRTGIGYALGALWIRHYRPDLASLLRPDSDPTNPYGFLRELVPGTPNGLQLPELYRLLKEIPENGLTRQELYDQLPKFKTELDQLFRGRPEPPAPYAIREMVLFGFSEEARNWKTVEVLNQLDHGINSDAVFQQLIEMGRAAHNGDRIVKHEITESPEGTLHYEEQHWEWGVSDEKLNELIRQSKEGETQADLWRQSGWLERSIEPIDLLVDLISLFNEQHGGNAAVGVIVGAGLGGTVAVLVQDEYREPLLAFLRKNYYQHLGLTYSEPISAQQGHPAGVLTLPKPQPVQPGGLEEKALAPEA